MLDLEKILKEDEVLLEKHTIEEFEQVKYGFDDLGTKEVIECYLEFVEQINNEQEKVDSEQQSIKTLKKQFKTFF